MAEKVNKDAVEHAKKLIRDGKIDRDSDWSEAQPSTDDENEFIEKEGWEAYARWHLTIDRQESEETKQRFGFPYGDFKKVHRDGIIAAKQRGAQYDHDDVVKATDELLEMIDGDS